MFSNNLLINSIETEKEKHFNHKCKTLLNYHSKESLIENCYKLEYIANRLVNDVLSFNDICYSLIKKYYISNHLINNITAEFNMHIEQLSFENAHQLLITNPILRQEVFRTYFNNIDISNNVLSAEKAYERGYAQVNMTLVELNNFFLSKREENNINQNKVLKKSYNFY